MDPFASQSSPCGADLRSEAFEALEQRLVLSAVENFPSFFDLESPNNPVVLFETSFGDIFLELFPQDAPTHVANFLEYVDRGLYGESFFHRLAEGFVLQGGGFAFDEDMGVSAIFDPDLPPIANDFGRPNLEYSVALATNAAGGTSQFFINLGNNSASLDGQGFTVFGQVLEMSESVVDTIAALDVEILSSDPAVTGDGVDRFGNPLFQNGAVIQLEDNGNPANFAGAFGFGLTDAVPVTGDFDGVIEEDALVHLGNAQRVKPDGGFGFFDGLITYPEGFASNQSSESLSIVNPYDDRIEYQVVIRYQDGLRDRTIASGQLFGGDSVDITLHDPDGMSLVDLNSPYSIEVYSAVELGGGPRGEDVAPGLPLGGSIERVDFGNTTSESLSSATPSINDPMSSAVVPNILVGENARSFLVWQNLSNEDRTVTVDFVYQDEFDVTQTITREFDLDAYRRGGFDVSQVPELAMMPEGTYVSAIIDATHSFDFRVAVSSFDVEEGGAFRPAFTTQGVGGVGDSRGIFPGVINPTNGRAVLSAINTSASATVVTLEAFVGSNGIPLIIPQTEFILQPGERGQVDLSEIVSIGIVPKDTEYTIRYRTTGGSNIAMDLIVELEDAGDAASVKAQTEGAEVFTAGNLFVDDATGSVNQALNVFNLFADQTITVQFTFVFSDGSEVETSLIAINPLSQFSFFASAFSGVTDKVASDPAAFSNFAVIAEGFDDVGEDSLPFFMTVNSDDLRTGVDAFDTDGASASPIGSTTPADSPNFLPGT